ncbi:AAA family ATPase [Solirubrobacter ginsenosidimutans]|uniref:AAA family ATPase n=1 Tax=Solirubrobacter ginsenosidimutans TaxID=490573 RepID=A0A9X3S3S8_9ACTN|nr:BTAD domain-containing putative transcriptional regulator [Solirubrobacter ginsenosidimutans]MDA0166050.1 AAA family ATPase [Solirubrobacter ginsenosidimutans]
MGLQFRILGPLEARGERGAVALGAGKVRVVLAVLLLRANEPVSAERLAMALWGDEAPAGAVKTVHVYVSRLRKALGDPALIETTPAGYRLRVRPGELDLERFERGVEAGRRALAAGQPERAAALLRDALGLWRGPALAELEFESFARNEIARLEEQRVAAIEARVDADLAAGADAGLVSELRPLLVEHPEREWLAGQLMLALYRSGRQTEALEVFRDARQRLVEAVGVEPGPQLARLHEAVLAHDESLELDAPELPRALDATLAPPLVGRDAELKRLREHWRAARGGTGRVVGVCGVAGIGKTRLAAELATEVHRAGGVVRLVGGPGPPAAAAAGPGPQSSAARPTLMVVDVADGELAFPAAELRRTAVVAPTLVLVCGRDVRAVAEAQPEEVLALAPLDAEVVRAFAVEHAVPPDRLWERSGGVPRRMHELAGQWAQREAARRVSVAAWRTEADRERLRAQEEELTGGVLALQTARDRVAAADEPGAPVLCPFKGLAAFDVDDAPFFFGRERLVAELVASLVGAGLLGVVGPSGSGKSSVVRAGLMPALAGGVLPGSEGWERALMRPGEHPLAELTRATTGIERNRRMVLAVDQFEETFTVCRDEAERRAFIGELAAKRDGAAVVLAIRADYYGRCGVYPELARQLAGHHVLVSAMRRDELRQAVERPAKRAGLEVEPELTEALLSEVEHEPGALPMLSSALLELWQRRDGRQLRLSSYEASGGVRGAVARHAEQAFARLDTAQQVAARGVLLRLTTEGSDGAIERRRIPLAELDEDVAQVVAILIDERLLTVSAGSVELAHEALLRKWPRLRGWLEEDADGRRLHRRLAEAAREWDAAGRDPGDLYRGARLAAAVEWHAHHDPELNRAERAFLHVSHDAERRDHVRRRRLMASALALLATIAGIATIVAVRGVQRARFEQRAAASRALATSAVAHLGDDPPLAGLLGLEAYRREPTSEARNAVLSMLPTLTGYRRVGRPLEHGAAVESIAISPDGRTLVSGADDGRIWLWDVASRRHIGWLAGHARPVNDVAISPDGRLLASASDDDTVRLWDLAARRPRGRPLVQHKTTATTVAFSPDGTTLASGQGGARLSNAYGQHATVRFWDVASGRALGRPLQIGTTSITELQFSPDGALLATSGDGTLSMWDVAARRPLWHVTELGAGGESVSFSPDGRTVAHIDDDPQLLDVRSGRPLRALEGRTGIDSVVAFSPDGRTLASGGQDGTVQLWSVATHRPRGVLVTDSNRDANLEGVGHVAGVLALAFSPRDDLLATADETGAVQLWNTAAAHPLDRQLPGDRSWIRAIAFTPAGTLASADLDGTLRLWDTRRARTLGPPVRHLGEILSLAADPDGDRLAIAGADGLLSLWSLQGRRPLGRLLNGQSGNVYAVAIDPDGSTLASGGDDGTVRLWDPRSGQPTGPPLNPGAGAIRSVAFGKDGQILAAGAQDGTVRLWDLPRRRPLAPLRGATRFVDALAFSPDGRTLASAGGDGSIWLWNVNTSRPLGPPLTGHADVISALSFSPDGNTLASAGADHTVRLWDVSAHHALGQPLNDATGWVNTLAFSPRGDQLASAGDDGTVRLWDPILWSRDRDALQHRICGVIRRNLTHTEWAQYLPGQAYRDTCPHTA